MATVNLNEDDIIKATQKTISLVQCKTAVTLVRKQWSYCSPAVSHEFNVIVFLCLKRDAAVITKTYKFFDNENTCHMKDPRPYEVCKPTFMLQNKIVQTLDSRHSLESNDEITDMGDKNLFKIETVNTKHMPQWRHIKINHLFLSQNPHQGTYVAGNIHKIIKHVPAHCAY